MLLHDARLTIDDECGGKRVNVGEVLPELGREHDNRIVDLVFGNKAPYRFRRTLVLRHTDDLQLSPVFLLQRDEIRNLSAAWRAPRCPEIYEDYLSPPIGTGKFPMVRITHGEFLQRFWITERRSVTGPLVGSFSCSLTLWT